MDSSCRALTASWVRDRHIVNGNGSHQNSKMVADIEELGELCSFYETFWNKSEGHKIPNGVYTLEDLKEYGKKVKMCPYFLARHFLL